MTDKPLRPQLNIRLDKYPTLLDEIKSCASDRSTTASQFILDAILTALGKPTTTTPTDTPSLEAILAEVDELIDEKLDKRLGEFEQRLLAEFRPNDRQPPPEELIEDRQVIEEDRPETKPDYQAIRDRILRSLRTRVATTSPQYKAATKVLDRFIAELETASFD
ncbi:hypothetical protein, partial [Nostoc sp.]